MPISDFTYLVDLSKTIYPILKDRLNRQKLCVWVGGHTFYETKGYELDRIDDNSIDFIFLLDTLVRVNKKYLMSYFYHFRRVLKSECIPILN